MAGPSPPTRFSYFARGNDVESRARRLDRFHRSCLDIEFTNDDGAGVCISYAKVAEFARQSGQARNKQINRLLSQPR